MNNNRWIPIVAAIVLSLVIGAVAYNAGVAHGIAQSGKIVAAPYPYAYPYPGWHPWGFPFFFAPFFFVVFGIVILRALFWRGAWHHHGRCGSRNLDEWHKQAHERMS